MSKIIKAVINFYFDLDAVEANVIMTGEWYYR